MKTMTLSISPNVLTTLPALFQSAEEALAEHLQNAYRAGATRLDITWDAANRKLTLVDDGQGMADPTPLLTAGESGWDAARQVWRPAGLGFFAWFGYAERIQVTSKASGYPGWTATMTPDHLQGTPITIDAAPTASEGTTVTVTANDAMSFHFLQERSDQWSRVYKECYRWRHQYPITVVVNGKEIPPAYAADRFTGLLGLDELGSITAYDAYPMRGGLYGEWEHRIVPQNLLTVDTDDSSWSPQGRWGMEVLRQWANPHVAKQADLLVNIPPQIGWEPKLPDRREWRVLRTWDDYLNQLGEAVARALNYDVWLALRHKIQAPKIVTKSRAAQWPEEVQALLDSWPFKPEPGWVWEALLGYRMARVVTSVGFFYDHAEQAPDITQGIEPVWVHPDYAIPSDAETLFAVTTPRVVDQSYLNVMHALETLVPFPVERDDEEITDPAVHIGPITKTITVTDQEDQTWRIVTTDHVTLGTDQAQWDLPWLMVGSAKPENPERIMSWEEFWERLTPESQARWRETFTPDQDQVDGTFIMVGDPKTPPKFADWEPILATAIPLTVWETDHNTWILADSDTDTSEWWDDLVEKLEIAWLKAWDPAKYAEETRQAAVERMRNRLYALKQIIELIRSDLGLLTDNKETAEATLEAAQQLATEWLQRLR